jgi:hypothetical protein
MAAAARVTVAQSAIQLAANPPGAPGGLLQVWLKNTGAVVVAIGGDNTVTAANGYELAITSGSIGPLELEPGDEIFGISASGNNVVQVLTV